MVVEINNKEYNLVIEKKVSTKNTYIRVRENLDIYVTCNRFTSDYSILKLIKDNEKSIERMLLRMEKKQQKEEFFYYMGRKYDLVYLNQKGIMFGEEKVFVSQDFKIDDWYKKEAQRIFQEELDKMYQSFIYEIPYPSLMIRKMKTRWGVCNTRLKKITLNLELIKKDKIYLDYVIVHELSHLLYPNHSKDFWQCVENNFKDYRKIRKELKYE